jgi:hypothetical protein
MLDVDAEDVFELAAAEDQQPVEAFAADCADPALHVRVRIRRLHRRPGHLDLLARQERIEGARELRVSVVDHEPHPPVAVIELHQQVAGLLQHPRRVRLLVQARYSMRRLPIERKTRTYTRRSQMLSTVKKSQARIDSPCARRKRGHDCESRRGAGGKPAPARMLRMEVAETATPSLRSSPHDPEIAPAWVLACDAED